MDREYKEMMYSSMFDELDRLQANKLYNNPELQKVAINISHIGQSAKGALQGAGRGLQSLVKDPTGFYGSIRSSFAKGSKQPVAGKAGGIAGGIKRVWETDPGKAAILGGTGIVGLGGLALANRRQPQQIIVQR